MMNIFIRKSRLYSPKYNSNLINKKILFVINKINKYISPSKAQWTSKGRKYKIKVGDSTNFRKGYRQSKQIGLEVNI